MLYTSIYLLIIKEQYMKVGIIGLGVVGSALLKAFKSLGNKCFGLDLKNIKQKRKSTESRYIIHLCTY